MPARPKTSDDEIIQAARALVERRGRDGFTMRDVAAAVGIRAPSLYGRFADRAGLIAAVELGLWAELAARLGAAMVAGDPAASLMAQSWAIRRFALANPFSYALFFDIRSPPSEAGNAARAGALAQIVAPLAALVGEGQAFAASRVLVAYLHGFISIELADGFRLGGGVDDAFESGVGAVLRGLTPAPGIDAKG